MNQQNSDNEIDLSVIQKKIDTFFDNSKSAFYSIIIFLIKNSLWIILLFIAGIAVGFIVDRGPKVYDTQIIVSPNFGSVDYMYNKVNLLQAKLQENDTVFLANHGIKNPSRILDIKVEPVVDIYYFINRSTPNFEMIKLLAEDSDMKKIIEDPVTSKNYQFQLITITTRHRTNNTFTVDPILAYLNSSPYFLKMQKENRYNMARRIQTNQQTIEQIDGILNSLGKEGTQNAAGQVYINQNTQLNDVIRTKNELIQEQGNLRLALVQNQRIIKESAVMLNIINSKGLAGKMKLILPFLFVLIFLLIKLLSRFYKTQSKKQTAQL